MEDLIDKRRRSDADQQRKTILGDQDAHELIARLKRLRSAGSTFTLEQSRRYHFLSDDADVVLNHQTDPNAYLVVDMPAGSVVHKVSGTSFKTSVYRIDNGQNGERREVVELAFRGVDSGDYLLYLKTRRLGERAPSGRSVGSRRMGRGPDSSQ